MKTLTTSDDKDAVIAALLERIEVLVAQNAALMALNASPVARVAELEAKLGLPPKTPDNSSLPPSKGRKPPLPSIPKRKAKPHPGAHRLLHADPTRHHDVLAVSCQACRADVSGTEQSPCETYDRVEIPKTEPDVTRVSPHGGTSLRSPPRPAPRAWPQGSSAHAVPGGSRQSHLRDWSRAPPSGPTFAASPPIIRTGLSCHEELIYVNNTRVGSAHRYAPGTSAEKDRAADGLTER